MNDRPQLASVETDVQKADRYKREIADKLAEIIPILNNAKRDGLRPSFGFGENPAGWFVANIEIVRPL